MNKDSFLLGAQQERIWSFGGPTAWKTTTYRGYFVSLEWYVEPKETQPCLIVQPARKAVDDGAHCICLGAVGLYLDQSGDLTREAYALCREALLVLGKPQLEIEIRNLMHVIHRWLPEVILMPPAPMSVRRAEAGPALIEVELRDENTGKVHQEVRL